MTQDSSLSPLIGGQNIVNRFNAIVVAEVNANIGWGLDNKPFGEMANSYFGGNTSGIPDYTTPLTGTITAQTIYDSATAAMRTMSSVRKLRARLNVTQTGSSPWNRSTASANQTYNPPATGGVPGGIVFDETQYAYMSTGYQQTVGTISRSDVQSSYIITRAGIEGGYVGLTLSDNTTTNPSSFRGLALNGFFQDCRTKMIALKDTTTTVTITVCHASCHSSCHGSRSRR